MISCHDCKYWKAPGITAIWNGYCSIERNKRKEYCEKDTYDTLTGVYYDSGDERQKRIYLRR